MNLVSELSPYVSPDPFSPNSRALSADKKVAITLYYLKDTGSLGATALSHPPFFITDYERSLCKMNENGIHFNF